MPTFDAWLPHSTQHFDTDSFSIILFSCSMYVSDAYSCIAENADGEMRKLLDRLPGQYETTRRFAAAELLQYANDFYGSTTENLCGSYSWTFRRGTRDEDCKK